MGSATEFYDALSVDYDLFVDWPSRLAYEMPLLEEHLRRQGARSVLDVACGTGQHAIALAQAGYEVVGVDVSPAMIDRARENAAAAGVEARFAVRGFGELAGLGRQFDALLCLGNSLPHLTDPAALAEGLADFHAVLRPGGGLIIQQRNFDRVLACQERYMPPQAASRGADEWLFVRFYDFDGADLTFNILRLHRRDGEGWEWRAEATDLRAWRAEELRRALVDAGFAEPETRGNLAGEPYDPATSGDLVLLATRR